MTFDGIHIKQEKIDDQVDVNDIVIENAEQLPFSSLAADKDKQNETIIKPSLFETKRIHRSESLFDPPQVSSLVI